LAGHPVVRWYEPGEDWYWCYLDRLLIREALHPYPGGLAIVSKVAVRRDDSGAVLPFDLDVESGFLHRGEALAVQVSQAARRLPSVDGVSSRSRHRGSSTRRASSRSAVTKCSFRPMILSGAAPLG
jgi:hypothetical protein